MVKFVALLAVAAVATTAQQFGYPQYGGLAFSSPAYASRGPAYGYQAPQAYGSFGAPVGYGGYYGQYAAPQQGFAQQQFAPQQMSVAVAAPAPAPAARQPRQPAMLSGATSRSAQVYSMLQPKAAPAPAAPAFQPRVAAVQQYSEGETFTQNGRTFMVTYEPEVAPVQASENNDMMKRLMMQQLMGGGGGSSNMMMYSMMQGGQMGGAGGENNMMQMLLMQKLMGGSGSLGGLGGASGCASDDPVCIANNAITADCNTLAAMSNSELSSAYPGNNMFNVMYKCDPTASSWIGQYLGMLG